MSENKKEKVENSKNVIYVRRLFLGKKEFS